MGSTYTDKTKKKRMRKTERAREGRGRVGENQPASQPRSQSSKGLVTS